MAAKSQSSGSELLGDRRAASKGERQRRAILDALQGLLRYRPIAELTVGEIASSAKVTRSGFYFYFDTKFAPLAVLLSEAYDDWTSQPSILLRFANETPAEYCRRCISSAAQTWNTHENIFVATFQAMPMDQTITDEWNKWNTRTESILEEQIRRDFDNSIAQRHYQDMRTLLKTLARMTQYELYKSRVDNYSDAEQEKMINALCHIWLVSLWGLDSAAGV
ncbi:TetR/AcrR family transcriptional regulator [Rhodococcus wratislaviensis]|uniref:HTH tetR-type domain-containing protein n=1 Tax=Rhodococcus wratislaviensis NBRC 100605 TaxID=1219028 RepID=X0Q0N3_RHOWR|nr:TetR/AcrR family transcriptional regulator [Rhodococcus wratislaviensis]GAF49478.1 hypothetical protein RW1_087_00050 [Rhodococcus wratislaviensis NBRC 100605]